MKQVLRQSIVLFFFSVALTAAQAQPDSIVKQLKILAGHVATFSERCPQEKVYLHFDNTAYFQGETIFYKAYLVNASTLGRAKSKVLYVELLSPTGVVLKQQKLKVVNSQCHGSFSLMDESVPYARSLRGMLSYPSGYYEVRAYTREMQNFDEATLFSRVFPVYETPEVDGNFDNPVLKSYKTDIEMKRPKSEKLKKVNIDFFPEGGNLVVGLPSKIAFKITDKEGCPLQVGGVVEKNVAFSTFHDGMGVFEFTPQKKNNSAIVTFEDKDYSFDLPKAIEKGYSLTVNALSNEELQFSVGKSAALPSEILGYTVMCREKVVAFDTITVPATGTTRTIDTQKFPAGVYQLTLYNEQGEVYAERLFFVRRDFQSTLQVDAPNYALQPFEKIKLQITATDEQQAPIASAFSLAVRDGSDYGTTYQDNIFTDLLLSSELKGYIHNPGYYFEADDLRHRRALDLLMMVQGWRRYEWKKMAGVTPFQINYYLEEGIVLDGKVLSRIQKKPLDNIVVDITAYNSDRSLRQDNNAKTDDNGYFGFQFADFVGEWDLSISIKEDDKDKPKNARIVIYRSQKPNPLAFAPYSLYLPARPTITETYDLMSDSLANSIETPELIDQDAYLLDEVVITEQRKYIDFCTFKAFDAGKATDEVLDCGEYTPVVIDYLKGLGYEIDIEPEYFDSATELSHVGKDSEQYIMSMLPICRLKNGLVYWDLIRTGKWETTIPVENPWYMNLEDVKSVIVYDSPTAYNSLPSVSKYSYTIQNAMDTYKIHRMYVVQLIPYEKNEFARFDKGKRQTTIVGYSEVKEFYSPSYAKGIIKGEKDYRRTLYWNPNVQTDSTGKASVEFYNNSRCKKISVSAEGFTQRGIPVYSP